MREPLSTYQVLATQSSGLGGCSLHVLPQMRVLVAVGCVFSYFVQVGGIAYPLCARCIVVQMERVTPMIHGLDHHIGDR